MPILGLFITIFLAHTIIKHTRHAILVRKQRVLYLFVILVLTIMNLNVMFFIGSVHCFRSLIEMPSSLGERKTTNTVWFNASNIRLGWGASWLFDIIPNIVAIDALLCVFVAISALQGLHKFLHLDLLEGRVFSQRKVTVVAQDCSLACGMFLGQIGVSEHSMAILFNDANVFITIMVLVWHSTELKTFFICLKSINYLLIVRKLALSYLLQKVLQHRIMISKLKVARFTR